MRYSETLQTSLKKNDINIRQPHSLASEARHHDRKATLNATPDMDSYTRFANKVSQCQQAIDYTFANELLCARALNAAADSRACYLIGGSVRTMAKNDRLAIYGDNIAAHRLCCLWLDAGLEPRE